MVSEAAFEAPAAPASPTAPAAPVASSPTFAFAAPCGLSRESTRSSAAHECTLELEAARGSEVDAARDAQVHSQ